MVAERDAFRIELWTPMIGPHRNHGCRLRDVVWRGRRCVWMENERLRVLVAPGKGCDILEFTHKPTDTECLWQAPAGLPLPGDLPPTPEPAGPFRDVWPGGWFLMLPNGPAPCLHAGANLGHHGEATLLGWDAAVEEDTASRIVLRASVRLRRTPLAVSRRLVLEAGAATLIVEEAVTNDAELPVEVLWGHHPTFAAPLLEPGTLICLPPGPIATGATIDGAGLAAGAAGRWPHLPDRDGAPVDLSCWPDGDAHASHDFILCDEARGWFALANVRRGVGFALRWNEELFPMLGIWRLNGGGAGYPCWGSRRLLALEPACHLPSLADAAARGTAILLSPGETRRTRLEASVFTATGVVENVAWGGSIVTSPFP